MRRFMSLVGVLVAVAIAGAAGALAALPAAVEVTLSAPGARFAPGTGVPVTVEATLPGVGSDRARVSVSTTEGLSLLSGATSGPAGERVFATTLRFLPTAPGWARADVTVQRVDEAGTVVGRDTNSLFFLFEDRDVWLSTSSAVDLRLQRLAALGGEAALEAGAPGEPGGAGSGQESVQSIIGSVVGGGPLAGAPGANEPGVNEPGVNEPGASAEPGSVTVQGRVLWTDRDGDTHPVPYAVVQVFDAGPGETLLGTTETDLIGDYSLAVSHADGDGGPDIFVRVLSQSSVALIHAPGVAQPYFIQSSTSADVPDGSVVTKNLTAGNSATNENAFSIHHALTVAGAYAGVLPQRLQWPNSDDTSMPSRLDTVYPTNEATFSFFKPSPVQLHIALKGPAVADLTAHAWDVIQQQYGHYVQAVGGFVDSPGGTSTFDVDLRTYDGERSASDASRLAWAEGWPTFFAISAQRYSGSAGLGIPTVGDTRYQAPYLGLDVDIGSEIGKGLYDPLSAAAVLFTALGLERQGVDPLIVPDTYAWLEFVTHSPVAAGGALSSLTNYLARTPKERADMWDAFSRYGFGSRLIAPEDGYNPDPEVPPTFVWQGSAGLSFVRADYLRNEILTLNGHGTGDGWSATPTSEQWRGVLSNNPAAAWFAGAPGAPLSGARVLNGPDLVLVVRDGTDAIDGLERGLQAFIDARPADAPPAKIQLIEGNTVCVVSTDPEDILATLAAGTPAGGTTCPVSTGLVDALTSAAWYVKAGGTIILATDEAPYLVSSFLPVIEELQAKGVALDVLLSENNGPVEEPAAAAASAGGSEPGDGAAPPLYPLTDPGQAMIDDHGGTDAKATAFLVNAGPVGVDMGLPDGPDARDAADYLKVWLEAGKVYSVTYRKRGKWGPDSLSRLTPAETGYTYFREEGHPYDLQLYQIAVGLDPLDSLSASAVSSYSTLSALTGGTFVYDPDTASDGYADAFQAMIERALLPKLVNAAPGHLEAGQTTTVELGGARTAWRSGDTTVELSPATGATVTAVRVLASNRLSVDIQVAAGTAAGLRDVRVVTLDGESVETEEARDLLQVVPAGTTGYLVGLSPDIVPQNGTLDVTVEGVGTSFGSASEPDFGAGVTVNATTVASPTKLVVNISVSPGAAVGFRTLQVDGLTLPDALFVQAEGSGLPLILSLAPASGAIGQTLDVTITAADTDFVDGVTSADFGPRISVNSVHVLDATTAVANITIAGNAGTTSYTVSVDTAGQVASLANAFTVETAPIRIVAGPFGRPDPVGSGAAVDLTLVATGPSGSTLSYAWTADCGVLGANGSFSDASAQQPTWTAPANPTGATQDCTIGVQVSGTGTDASVGASYTQSVEPAVYPIVFTSGPSSDTNPAYSGGEAVFSVVAESDSPQPLHYAWTADCPGDADGTLGDATAATTTWTAPTVAGTTQCAVQVTVTSGENSEQTGSFVETVLVPPSTTVQVYANVLPSSRSGRVGVPATAFASMVNDGPVGAANCTIAPTTDVPASFTFQRTDPETNAAVGVQGQPANIPADGAQTFVIGLTPTEAFDPTEVEFAFDCANSEPAPSVVGLNSLLLSGSTGTPADVIAIVASTGNDGIARVPGVDGTGFFTVAGINIANDATLAVDALPNAGVPVALSWCETTGTPDGSCLQAPTAYPLPSFLGLDLVKTYTVFVAGTGTPIPNDLAASRVTFRFREGDTIRGSTSIAVQTQTTDSLAALAD